MKQTTKHRRAAGSTHRLHRGGRAQDESPCAPSHTCSLSLIDTSLETSTRRATAGVRLPAPQTTSLTHSAAAVPSIRDPDDQHAGAFFPQQQSSPAESKTGRVIHSHGLVCKEATLHGAPPPQEERSNRHKHKRSPCRVREETRPPTLPPHHWGTELCHKLAPSLGQTRLLRSHFFIHRTRGPGELGPKSSPVLPASYTPTVGCSWKTCSQPRTWIYS